MQKTQYIIVNRKGRELTDKNWNTILFDSQEEAEELILDHPEVFEHPMHLEIKPGIFFIDDSVNYKDIKNVYWKET